MATVVEKSNLLEDAALIVDVCFSVEEDDVVTIICDDEREDEARAIAEVCVERGAAGVPAEVVELVADVGHVEPVQHLAVGRRAGVQVDHRQRVGPRTVAREQRRVAEALALGLHGQSRRGVEGGVGTQRFEHGGLLRRTGASP